ncbi:MAG: ABC transporter substrate-binding protein [Gemmatimonadota bacterium]
MTGSLLPLPVALRYALAGFALCVLLTSLALGPNLANAQTTAHAVRVGVLSDRTPAGPERAFFDAFRSALRQHGWVEGSNLTLIERFAGDDVHRLPTLAAELVAARVDVIFATTLPAALAAQGSTREIPIVFNVLSDPVEQGLIGALARPGGNVTGMAINSSTLIPKRLQFLKEAMPQLKRVAVLLDPDQGDACEAAWSALREPAQAMGVTLERVPAGGTADYAHVFSLIARHHLQAVLVPATTRFYNDARTIARLASMHRIVVLPPIGDVAEDDALLVYGPRQVDAYERAASYIDRVLRGADPATLPVEQPTRYELVLNKRVARALGVRFPRALSVRADRVIE